jgi:hypothetical protein
VGYAMCSERGYLVIRVGGVFVRETDVIMEWNCVGGVFEI